jgi:hypothetical protein
MLDRVHHAGMAASRHDDQAITRVNYQRLLVGDGIDRQCAALAHQISLKSL